MCDPRRTKKLRWRCRRGVRELDLLFGRYLDELWSQQTPEEQATFEQFIEEGDQDILSWVMGNRTGYDRAYDAIIRQLRSLMGSSTE